MFMLRSFSALSAVAAFALLVGAATPAAMAKTPVHVMKCDPIAPRTTVNYAGFTPAFYPPGPYYWNDPYGYRYRQYPLSAMTSTTGAQLAIHYVNVTPAPIKQIDFGLVAKGILVAEVRDVGTFSHGAEIKHTFGLNPNVFPISTGLPECVPLRVTYANGTVWHNPRLPHANPGLYT